MAEKKPAEDQSGNKKGKLKLIIIGVVALLLIVAVGAGAYILGMSKSGEEGSAKTTSQAPVDPDAIGPMIEIEPFIVNILDQDGARFLKTAITLELERIEGVQEVQERMPQLRDAILMVVSNKTFGEIRDLQGKMQLRAELQGRLNEILRNSRIKRIYFTEFVVQ